MLLLANIHLFRIAINRLARHLIMAVSATDESISRGLILNCLRQIILRKPVDSIYHRWMRFWYRAGLVREALRAKLAQSPMHARKKFPILASVWHADGGAGSSAHDRADSDCKLNRIWRNRSPRGWPDDRMGVREQTSNGLPKMIWVAQCGLAPIHA